MTAGQASATNRVESSTGFRSLVETLWLVNGEPAGVDPADRGLAYGDGLFETMAARDGSVTRIDWHFERLEEGSRRLEIPCPQRALLEHEIVAAIPRTGRAVVKLILTRGSGTRGYRPSGNAKPTRVLAVSPWPDRPSHYYETGIRLATCRLRLGENPALAGMKHLARLEHVLAEIELRDRDADQGLLLDTSGRVVSGTSSNVFAVHAGKLTTPLLTRAGVAGIMRRAVMGAARELGLDAEERDLLPTELRAADEIFVTNSLIGIWPVAVLDREPVPVGTVTRRLMQHLRVRDA